MLSYDELLEKYIMLLREHKALKAENEMLKDKLGICEKEHPLTNALVNKRSLPEEKIKLFRSLFKGREDVFARRWYSQSLNKGGYQPVCENEWKDGVCNKKQYKCNECPNRKLAPLTDKDIYNHLAGKDYYCRDVIGIYPLLKNDNCNFLVFDFDDGKFKNDVTAVHYVFNNYDIPTYIEISRSGTGAHIWVFFEEEINAADARKLGSAILTEAMKENTDISFKSYDRMFPNQDTMPKGGFGNLIALPLQGKARKNDGSVFVDESFCPYSDQWAFLSKIKRLNKTSFEHLLSKLCKDDELGVLMSSSDSEPSKTKKENELTAFDISNTLEIVQANMLYVPCKYLSANAQNAIKRLAAFKNPDFYRAQAMRLPIYNKPRIISTAEITDEYIALPRGCKTALDKLLDNANINYTYIDKTNAGDSIIATFNGELREEQKPAAEALLSNDIGVLSATTAFGKTVIASYIIAQRKVNTLVLVHTHALMKQWQKSLEQFLTIDITQPEYKGRGRRKKWSPIGTLGGGTNSLNGAVDVAVMQSLADGDEVKEFVRNYGMIIVDECHHISAVNFERILKYANAKYVYGLTATPTRQDGHHPIIFMQCGPIRYRVNAKLQAEKRNFEHFIIPRFTSFRDVAINERTITQVYKGLAESEIRNKLIVADVKTALENGRTPIVLTERREHVLLLAQELQSYCKNVITLFGTPSAKERRDSLEQLQVISDNEQAVVVATGKYAGEGFDYSRLDTLFLALPIAWKGKVAQYAGRLHRNYEGKTEVQIYDYIDINVPVLERMYQKRLKGYAAIGYKVKTDVTPLQKSDIIYDGKNYFEIFKSDLENVQKEIVIVSPFISKSKLTMLIKYLSSMILNGITIIIVTKDINCFNINKHDDIEDVYNQISNYGIKLIQKEKLSECFTVIDQQLSWYGSINYLAFSKETDNAIRIDNGEIAGMLLDTIA